MLGIYPKPGGVTSLFIRYGIKVFHAARHGDGRAELGHMHISSARPGETAQPLVPFEGAFFLFNFSSYTRDYVQSVTVFKET